MVLTYRKSESTEPITELIDSHSSKKCVFIRRNVQAVTRTNMDGDEYTAYEYEEAKLTKDEYARYLDEINAGTVMETMEEFKVLVDTEHKDIENTDLTIMDKLLLFIDSIEVIDPEGTVVEEKVAADPSKKNKKNKKFPEKKGYKWKPKYNGNAFVWELVEDDDYVPVNDGSDYTLAIPWYPGDKVTKGLWYNVGDDLIWQAIKTGVPSGPDDKKYFDII